jgi:hypothetical protein
MISSLTKLRFLGRLRIAVSTWEEEEIIKGVYVINGV